MRSLHWLILAAAAVAPAAQGAPGGGPAETMHLDVDVLRSQTLRRDGDVLRPLARVFSLPADAGRGLLIEAADAHERLGRVRRDASAGTDYVADCRVIRARVRFPDAGSRAVLWARLRHGGDDTRIVVDWGSLPAGWGTTTWSSRAAYARRGLDADAQNAKDGGRWRWERIGPADFRRDGGTWRVEARWAGAWHGRGCPDIDKLMIVPGDGTPESVRPETRQADVGEHVVYSVPLHWPAAKRLTGASLVGDARASGIEFSADGGRTWLPAETGGALHGSLLLRATLAADLPEDAAIRRFEVKVATAEPVTRLTAGDVRILLDPDQCGVLRMAAAGRSLAAPVRAIPLLTLELKKRGQPWPEPRKVLTPDADSLLDATADPQAGLRLRFRLLDGAIDAVVRIAPDGPRLLWQLDVDNRSEWDVLNVTFPRLAGVRIGDSGTDDRFANTGLYGPWVASLHPEDRPYPGWGALGWCDLYDADAGLALSVVDPLTGATTFRLRPDLATRQTPETNRLEAVWEHCIAAGEKGSVRYAMLAHAGDWHAAADDYRGRFEARFGRADHWPDWFVDSNGWIAVNPHLHDRFFKWPMLEEHYETGRRLGLNHLQVWGQFGSTSCSSFWWPSPKYGPIEQFAATAAAIRRRGGHVGGYFLYSPFNRFNLLDARTRDGYLPRSAYPDGVPELAPDAYRAAVLVQDPRGRPTGWPFDPSQRESVQAAIAKLHAAGKPTIWADGAMTEMLARDAGWRDWMRRWVVDLYAGRWHCDTPYIDVLGCKHQRSFDLRRGEHGHVLNEGEMGMARELLAAGRKADGDFVLLAEGKNELVTRYAAGLSSSQHPGWRQLGPHRYTHPDHVLFFGSQNGAWRENLDAMLNAYLYGAKFDLLLIGDVYRIGQLVTMRQAFVRYVMRATCRDTVGIAWDGRDIEARRFDRIGDDVRAVTVCVVNPAQADGGRLTVDVSALGDGPTAAIWLTPDGAPQRAEIARTGAKVTTAVPPAFASALVLATRPPAGEELLAMVRPHVGLSAPDDGEPRPVARCRWWVVNLSDRPAKLAARLEGPDLDRGLSIEVPAGGVARGVETWATNEPTAGGDVVLSIDPGGQRRQLARGFLWPPVADGSFEDYHRPQASGEPADGKRFLQFPPAEGWQGEHKSLHLRPGGTYRVRLMGRRSGEDGTIHALVRMRSRAEGWKYGGLYFPKGKFNRWVPLEVRVTAPDDLAEADIYFYNNDSRETAGYDDLRVELLAEPR